jgi:hypothetical protein
MSNVAKMALKSYTTAENYGQLAQLVRAFASHARGQRFESFIVHSLPHLRQQTPAFFKAIVR